MKRPTFSEFGRNELFTLSLLEFGDELNELGRVKFDLTYERVIFDIHEVYIYLEFCAVSFSVLDPKSIGNKRGMKDQEVKNILSCINDILVLYSKGGSLDKICTVKLSNEKKGAKEPNKLIFKVRTFHLKCVVVIS